MFVGLVPSITLFYYQHGCFYELFVINIVEKYSENCPVITRQESCKFGMNQDQQSKFVKYYTE
jgi:hypothetical protein